MCLLSFVTRYYVLKFGIGFFDLVPMDVCTFYNRRLYSIL